MELRVACPCSPVRRAEATTVINSSTSAFSLAVMARSAPRLEVKFDFSLDDHRRVER